MAHDADSRETNLGSQWWQFMSSIPAFENPLLDQTGAKCLVGQRGDIWFLGGLMGVTPEGEVAQGGGVVTRNCSIPQGKKLFFPVINSVVFDSPDICGQGSDSFSYEDMREQVSNQTDAAIDMKVTLDGREVRNLKRFRPQPIDISLPENSAWDALCRAFDLGGVPAGIYAGTQDGYYLTLNPLPVGQHQLKIHGALKPPNEFTLDIVYNLNVVAVP
ncbi:hypothetical protein A1342_01070 [Methylomonas methanica]|uniref:Uncharacterized protein n=2 Tax=Methylomonas TaxID=416 RepID=A0A140E3C0_9GAMM|nr:hypothetical protein JT25_000070 [Methylomonas denitrificans]OAH97357.1 hypothetical protein A1342_01070 [Methylomonas methanica]